jgi:nitrogen fixation protein NifU and related proteins
MRSRAGSIPVLYSFDLKSSVSFMIASSLETSYATIGRMDLYAETILDHFRHPRNTGALARATVKHEEHNHACGDSLHVWLLIEDGIITKTGWEGEGCAIAQASMSMLSEELAGKPMEEIVHLPAQVIYDMLGIPIGPRRFKCALMSLHTVKNALHKALGEALQSWVETVAVED